VGGGTTLERAVTALDGTALDGTALEQTVATVRGYFATRMEISASIESDL
jgi:hypothetical protein